VGKEEITERDIEPWSVFNTLGRWYVTGRCRLVDDERTFRIDRIRSAETLEESFEPPSQIPDPVVGYTPSEGDVSCLIALTPRARWVLEYYPVEVVGTEREETIVRFSSPESEVPARLLVRLGESARLVEGEEVRKRLRQLGKNLLSTYQ
jgi:proteasome accessory factor C